MIEPLQEMPDGTIGFRASGRVTREEYREIVLPAMRAATEAGDVRSRTQEYFDRAEALAAAGLDPSSAR